MSSQQQRAETVAEEDLTKGLILPLVTSPGQPDKFPGVEDAEESDKYNIVRRYLEDQAVVITHFMEVLEEVRRLQKNEKEPQKLCQLIDQQTTLEHHILRLVTESDDIRWQVVSRNGMLAFSDSAAQRLLDIQGQIGQAIGALSTVGAGLSFSLLFSASRGDLWYMFAAWWMFLMGLTVTGGLGMASAGNDDLTKRPSQSEWTSRRCTLLGIVISILSVIGGFISLSVAAISFDLTSELETGKGVISGPTPGPFRRYPVGKAFDFIILIGFELAFLAGFLRALRPSLHLTDMKARRVRRQWMLDPSRSGRPVRARTLGDLLGEGVH